MHTQTDDHSTHIDDHDWSTWAPGILSTLVFVHQDNKLLLIQKKTGLGAGKVNGPGGKLEPGELWIDCARREVSEELEVQVGALWWCAELRFVMSDCPDILCHAFITDTLKGTPTETREAVPFWSMIHEVPWAQRLVVSGVVDGARAVAPGHDLRVRHALRPLLPAQELEQTGDLPLVHVWAAEAHASVEGLRGDLRAGPHDLHLGRRLHPPQLVHQ